MASREAKNPENILQRNTKRMVLREAPGGGAEQNPEHAESVLSRHRCVPKIASPEARKNRMYYGPTEPRLQESGLLA